VWLPPGVRWERPPLPLIWATHAGGRGCCHASLPHVLAGRGAGLAIYAGPSHVCRMGAARDAPTASVWQPTCESAAMKPPPHVPGGCWPRRPPRATCSGERTDERSGGRIASARPRCQTADAWQPVISRGRSSTRA